MDDANKLQPRRHFAALDGLRGVAALQVVVLHILIPFDLQALTPHAGLAVDFFFCLSGFVVGYAYEQRLLRAMSFWQFAAVRVIRLYPLIVFGTLTGFAVFIAKSATLHLSPFTVGSIVALISELFMVPTPIIVGRDWTEVAPYNPPAWSLSFEFLASFLYAACVHHLTKAVLITLLVFGAVIVFVLSYSLGGVGGGNHWHDLHYGLGRVFFSFLCGLFLFRLWSARALNRLVFPIISTILLAVFLCRVPTTVNWLYEGIAVILVFPLLVWAGARDAPSLLATKVYLFLGQLSYPLYILHYPLVRVFSNFARSQDLDGAGLGLLIVVEILCVIGFSIAVLKLIDEPGRAWLSRKYGSRLK